MRYNKLPELPSSLLAISAQAIADSNMDVVAAAASAFLCSGENIKTNTTEDLFTAPSTTSLSTNQSASVFDVRFSVPGIEGTAVDGKPGPSSAALPVGPRCSTSGGGARSSGNEIPSVTKTAGMIPRKVKLQMSSSYPFLPHAQEKEPLVMAMPIQASDVLFEAVCNRYRGLEQCRRQMEMEQMHQHDGNANWALMVGIGIANGGLWGEPPLQLVQPVAQALPPQQPVHIDWDDDEDPVDNNGGNGGQQIAEENGEDPMDNNGGNGGQQIAENGEDPMDNNGGNGGQQIADENGEDPMDNNGGDGGQQIADENGEDQMDNNGGDGGQQIADENGNNQDQINDHGDGGQQMVDEVGHGQNHADDIEDGIQQMMDLNYGALWGDLMANQGAVGQQIADAEGNVQLGNNDDGQEEQQQINNVDNGDSNDEDFQHQVTDSGSDMDLPGQEPAPMENSFMFTSSTIPPLVLTPDSLSDHLVRALAPFTSTSHYNFYARRQQKQLRRRQKQPILAAQVKIKKKHASNRRPEVRHCQQKLQNKHKNSTNLENDKFQPLFGGHLVDTILKKSPLGRADYIDDGCEQIHKKNNVPEDGKKTKLKGQMMDLFDAPLSKASNRAAFCGARFRGPPIRPCRRHRPYTFCHFPVSRMDLGERLRISTDTTAQLLVAQQSTLCSLNLVDMSMAQSATQICRHLHSSGAMLSQLRTLRLNSTELLRQPRRPMLPSMMAPPTRPLCRARLLPSLFSTSSSSSSPSAGSSPCSRSEYVKEWVGCSSATPSQEATSSRAAVAICPHVDSDSAESQAPSQTLTPACNNNGGGDDDNPTSESSTTDSSNLSSELFLDRRLLELDPQHQRSLRPQRRLLLPSGPTGGCPCCPASSNRNPSSKPSAGPLFMPSPTTMPVFDLDTPVPQFTEFCPGLYHLHMVQGLSYNVEDEQQTEFLDRVISPLHRLQTLELSEWKGLSSLEPLLRVQSTLTTLILYDVPKIEAYIPTLSKLTSIRSLDISQSYSDAFFGMNPEAASSLYARPVTALHTLVTSLTNLTHLDISCTNLMERPNDNDRPFGQQKSSQQSPYLIIPGLTFLPNRLHFLGIFGCPALVTGGGGEPDPPPPANNNGADDDPNPGVPADSVAGDQTESQLLMAMARYVDRSSMVTLVANEAYQRYRYGTNNKRQLEAMGLMLTVLERYVQSVTVQIPGVAALYYIMKGLQSKFTQLMKRRIISAILSGLEAHMDERVMVRNCCLCLCHFEMPMDVMFAYGRVVTSMVQVLDSHSVDGIICSIGVYLMYAMACRVEFEERMIMGQKGAIGAVMKQINRKTQQNVCDEVMENGWSFLWNVTDETPDNCSKFIHLDGFDLFKRCYTRFPEETDLVRNMMGLVGNIAEVQSLRRFLLKDGPLMGIICTLVDTPQQPNNENPLQQPPPDLAIYPNNNSLEISYNAAGVLANLLSEGDDAWELESPSLSPSLVDLFKIPAQLDATVKRLTGAAWRADVGRRIIEASKRWDMNTRRLINYRSFQPILRLVPMHDSVGSQRWAVWALANLTTTDPDAYCHFVVDEGGIDLLVQLLRNIDGDDGPLPPGGQAAIIGQQQEERQQLARLAQTVLDNVHKWKVNKKREYENKMPLDDEVAAGDQATNESSLKQQNGGGGGQEESMDDGI